VRLYQVTCITLDFVLFKGGWYILILSVGSRNTIFRCSSHWVFSTFVASVTMAKKFRSKCLRGRQRQLKQVHAGLPNAYQEGRSDRACFSRTDANPPAATTGCTVCLATASAAAVTSAYDIDCPKGHRKTQRKVHGLNPGPSQHLITGRS